MTAIYARQSVEKDGSLSIEGQIDLCRKHATGEVAVYEDRGFSGKNTNRPAFTALMDAVRAGEVSKILVYRLDRFSRSIADFSQIWNILEQNGVEFESVTENFDTSSPMGRAMLTIVMTFAQLERETTAERVRDNYLHRFALGAWPGGPAPYGFDLTKLRDADGRHISALAPNADSAIVRRIFELYAEDGASLSSVARHLAAQGISSPKRATWDNVSLSRLLHSPLYVRADEDVYWHYLAKGLQIEQEIATFDGKHACNVIGRRDRSRNKYNSLERQHLTVANHEGIVDAELWLRVQDKLSQNRQLSKSGAGKHSWLTGLLKCAKCGYALKISRESATNRYYIVCSGRYNLRACDVSSVNVDLRELESEVASAIKRHLAEAPPEAVWSDSSPDAAELRAIETRIERLVNAIAESSDVAVGYISRQIDALHRRREELLAQLRRTKPASKQRLDFDRASFAEKKLIAAEFIERILLSDENAEIVWKI